jgi:hypothetical protein
MRFTIDQLNRLQLAGIIADCVVKDEDVPLCDRERGWRWIELMDTIGEPRSQDEARRDLNPSGVDWRRHHNRTRYKRS